MKRADRGGLLVYGNCQAEAMAMALRTEPSQRRRFKISYVCSDPPSEEAARTIAPALSTCTLLLEQRDRVEFPYRDRLPPGCAVVSFPALEFGLLWPFNRPNPYDGVAAGERFPKFPYGDRVIVDLLDRKLPADEILRYYLTSFETYGPDLDVLYNYEVYRLRKAEAECDVKMADYILDRFRDERLFWTISHPTGTLLRELSRRLVEASSLPQLEDDQFPEVLEPFEVPVHPAIAEQFKLRWYDPHASYRADEVVYPLYRDYFKNMIEHSLATGRTEEKDAVPPSSPARPLKPLVVLGDAQAYAIALVLRHIPAVAERFEVIYKDVGAALNPQTKARLAEGALLCTQVATSALPDGGAVPATVRRIRFPSLKFSALWPFHSINSFDRPEPPDFPFGRFPYGDSFVVSCVQNDVPLREIMHFCLAPEWNPSWPNLDALLAAETQRLQTEDANNDVKIGTFILDRFQAERLFWTVDTPINALLAELIIRLLDAMLKEPVARAETLKIFSDVAPREFFGTLAVPIHPYVARHFGLAWYKAGERHKHFGDPLMSYGKYFERMIEHSYSVKNGRSQRSA